MKKSILIVSSICLFSLVSYGQEKIATGHTTPQAVIARPSLKVQAEKIQQKELQLEQAATASRGQSIQLKEELKTLNQEYKVLLTKELESTIDEATRKELSVELRHVEKQLGVSSSSR